MFLQTPCNCASFIIELIWWNFHWRVKVLELVRYFFGCLSYIFGINRWTSELLRAICWHTDIYESNLESMPCMPPYSAISDQKGFKLNFMKYKNVFFCLFVEGGFYPDLSLNVWVIVHVNSRQRKPFIQPFSTLRQTLSVKYHSSNKIIETVGTKDNTWKWLNQFIFRWTLDSTLWGLRGLNLVLVFAYFPLGIFHSENGIELFGLWTVHTKMAMRFG